MQRSLRVGASLVAAVGVAAYLGSVAWLKVNEDRLVYEVATSRRNVRPLDPNLFAPGTLRTPDGLRLQSVTLAPPAGRADPFWVLFLHGNGASIQTPDVQDKLRTLRELGYGVYAIDYRGFGASGGTPSEAGLYEDGMTAYRHLTGARGVAASRLLIFGHSLGSGVAVELATRVQAAGLVLDGAFTSIPDAGQARYPWMPVRLLARNRFESIAKIDRVHMPVLCIHSVGDTFVPYEEGRALFEKAHEPKHWLEVSDGHISGGFSDVKTLGLAMARILLP
jgi:fermentation-respiration switch protein FrsA (DUF1100 family)